jgi:anti-sigma regulatory factor (Ser/Thr protein kinase)
VAVALENARLYDDMKKSEEQRKQFYRDVICAATHNKLMLCDRWELNTPERAPDLIMRIETAEEIYSVRSKLGEMSRGIFSDEDRLDSLILCVGEGATHADKHGNGGIVSAWIEDEHLLVRIEDQGPGIDATTLPKATLQAGFSTKTSLGMGLTIILDFVDQLNLATDTGGTIIDMIVSKEVQEKDPLESLGLAAYL